MIHTLNELNVNANGQLIEENYAEDFLHLTFIELDGNSNQSWLMLLEKIKLYISKFKIELVVIDRCGDPCNLEDTQGGYGPSSLQMLNSLASICKTIIITDDWTYYYNTNKNIKFVGINLWHLSQKNIHKYYQFQNTVYDTSLVKTRPLMCLNRNMEWHRIYLLYLLHNKSWFNDIDYSFILPLNKRMEKPFIKNYFTDSEINTISSIITPIFLKEEINKDIIVMYELGASSVNIPAYENCAINLITETSVVADTGIVLTEKTCKAIMAYQIPILISNPGASQWLEDLGIDMFSDYIPWKQWDRILNPKDRVYKIVEHVNMLMQDIDAIMTAHHSFHTRLRLNKQRFHSQEFGNILLKQIS